MTLRYLIFEFPLLTFYILVVRKNTAQFNLGRFYQYEIGIQKKKALENGYDKRKNIIKYFIRIFNYKFLIREFMIICN